MSSLLAVLLLGSFILLAIPANADDPIHTYCPGNMNDTRGSAFQANLNVLLSFLPAAAAASTGFAWNVSGTSEQAFGLAQCRADVNASDCRACLDDAAREVTSTCPGQKTAALIYDMCLLRYSSANFFGFVDTSRPMYIWNVNNATQQVRFAYTLSTLMSSLTQKASASPRMFAAGSDALTSFENIYGMAQCTRDLTDDACKFCLAAAADKFIPDCCAGNQGGQIINLSCSIRFEVYPFYNIQAAEAAMSPALSPGGGPINGSDHFVPGSRGGGSNRTVRTRLLVSVPVSFTLLVLMCFAVYICKIRNSHANDEMGSLESLQYDLSTLQSATDNFSEQNKLGRGAFGPVYKGKLLDGQEIAVKRLSKTSQQGQAEMKNEVALVAKLQHKNLVRLLGYCIEKHEKLLVYEFLSNKSLDKILYGPARQLELSWAQRYKIIYGIGRGLMYLHEDSRLTIIHRDLKPGNILLDADMNPKISDFGLAKLFHIDLIVANTSHIAGTRGYMAPEYVLSGIFSDKSDVFSYGVLVLEVITSRQPSQDLLKFVWRNWSQGNVPALLENCPSDELEQLQMLRCIHIGLLCVQDDSELRPRMADVVLMLNSHSITLAVPTEPVFQATSERPTVLAPESSINEASVSNVEPR